MAHTFHSARSQRQYGLGHPMPGLRLLISTEHDSVIWWIQVQTDMSCTLSTK